MKFVITFIFLVAISFTSSAQCEYTWYRNGNIADDTITYNGQIFRGEKEDININFEELIKKIQVPRFPEQSINAFRATIDYLRTINTDSAKAEIVALEYNLESKFQILELDSIQYALYKIDTVKVKNRTIPIYKFTTSFYKEWDEDNNNYYFYYSPKYGVLHTFNSEIYPKVGVVAYTLANSCNLSGEDKKVVKYLTDYINKHLF